MGIPSRTHILRMVSIFVALAMIVPGVVLTQQFKADVAGIQTGARSGPTTYAWVNFESQAQANMLNDIGANIVSLRENGAYVKITEGQKNYLSTQLVMNDLPTRTEVNLAEQGIQFDSQVGYDLPAELRNAGTNEYLVQYTLPADESWSNGLKAITGTFLREIGDNLVVVKMNDNQKAKVERLDYVQWVGAYEPGFKLDKNIPATGTVKITVDGYPNTDIPALINTLTAMGASEIEDTTYGTVNCYIAASALPAVAKLDSVMLVWNLPEMEAKNNVGGRISQAQDLWVTTVSNLPQMIAGQGQIVHVQDSGLDASHRDFTMGPLGNRILYAESTTDADVASSGHGTHTAGTACGNGYDMEAYLGLSTSDRVYNSLAATNPSGRPDRMGFAGRAPEATLYHRAGFTDADWAAGYTAGARVFSNSWGPIIIDNTYSATADTFMAANTGALVVFAAGNDGPATNTVSGDGNGKLVLCVGAVENMRPIQFDSSDDNNQMASFSSRGPVADGRIKPDVVEIGTAVFSTKSDDIAEVDYPGLYDPLIPINNDPDATYDYSEMQGTSMACPAAAGDSILIRDYLVDIKGIAVPSANLMKTLIIHGAEDMGLGYPSMDQGWGRVNVRNSLCPVFPNVLQWVHNEAGIGAGTWNARTNGLMTTYVIDNTVPLKVTMTHWDATGAGTLTYDLDLVVTSPSGVRYEGNAFSEAWSTPIANAAAWSTCHFPSWAGGAAYDYDTANDGGDDINNIEMFRVKYPEKGQWDIQVVWKSSTARPFSIAITGGFNASADVNAATNVYKVNMLLDMPRVIPERDDFGEGTFKCAPDGSVIVPYWINNGGTTNDVYSMSAPLLPAGFTVTYYPGSPVSVNANKRLHGYARIMVAAGTSAGTYTLAFKALSNNDGTAPIAESTIKFQIDVVTTKTPSTITVAGSPAHEAAPSFISWTDAGTYYIGCAFTRDDRYGDRVYFTLSNNGGSTWSTPVAVSEPSWAPGYVTIERATSGTYAGRLAIAYNAWNPVAIGGDSADTRNAYIRVHTSTNNGATWSAGIAAWALGTGVSVGNTYRTVNINWYVPGNQFYLTVECFGYTDTTNYQQDAIATIGKSSADGGATWSAQVRIDPAVAGMYYFFPSVETDMLGNLALYYYQRDSGDLAQDRDASYQYYTGTWSAMRLAWDTPDNLMMPQTAVSNQGANGNRAYGAYLKGANTDGDRELYLIYTDNPNGNPPTFVTNFGPFGPIMSDHDYGTRFVFDLEWSNGYLYTFGHRNVKYDPYGQPNMLTVYDNDFTVAPVPSVDYLTLDSYVHGKQRAAATTNGAVAKVFVAQNVMTNKGGHDIIGMHVYNGWQGAVDAIGPVTEYISADKTVLNAGDIVTVIANVHDWTTGGSNIAAAQYKTDVSNVTGVAMQSLDGLLNSPAEAVQSTTTKINTLGWSSGLHWIFVRGQDSIGNWGNWVGIQVYVNPQVPATGTVTGPIGTSNVAAVTITYEWEGVPTSLNIYYTTNTVSPYTWTLIGNEATLDGTRAYTIVGGSATYGWKASAVGGATTELSPPAATDPPEATYVYDVTAPAAPTLNEVDRWGPTVTYGAPVTETRYMRGTANEATVNGLTCYSLGTADSTTSGNWGPGNNVAIYLGMRVYHRTTAGVETEITSGLSAQVARTAAGSGFQTATWTPPVTILATGESIVIKVYGDTTANPTTLRATFTTTALGPIRLEANEWTVQYWTRYAGNPNGSDWYWGATAYTSPITGFMYSSVVARDPLQDNTLNWTASGSPDVVSYNIYRAAVSGGPYTLIGNVPFGTNTYLDSMRGNADATLWWYHVDAVDGAGNTGTSSNVQEMNPPSNPAYAIPLTGKTANSWVFVSFPSAMSGAINTILTDPVDSGTTWTVAKWFNIQDKNDPWKTYRVGSSVNDMPTLTNQMGVWLWITANGGDQKLSLSSFVANSSVNVVINLYTGWNLVGYPTATSRAESATLTNAFIDLVASWQVASPYITQHAKGATLMVPGNAYWVHTTADCTWSVAP